MILYKTRETTVFSLMVHLGDDENDELCSITVRQTLKIREFHRITLKTKLCVYKRFCLL